MQVHTKPRFRIGSDGSNLREVGVGGRSVGANYMRVDHSPFFVQWNPALRDQRDDVSAAYTRAAARTIDMMHNSGWLAGAFDQAIASTVGGSGLRLAAKPDAKALGMTKDEADAWAKDVEREYELWATNPDECDATGQQTLAQMDKAVLNSHFSHGEGLALLPKVDRPWSTTQTKVKLLPAHKLTQTSNGTDMFQGVRTDGWGFPLGYNIELRLDSGWDSERPVDVIARDPTGRRQVLHIFDGVAGQVRGISPLAPALKVVRQFDQLSDATLQAALIQAIFAATVESQAPTAEVLQALNDEDEQGVGGGDLADLLEAKAGFYARTKIDLGRAGKFVHLFPGEQLKFNRSEHPNSIYEAFAKFLLREIARCLGMTFEALTGDYAGATYSSVRMATAELWPTILYRRLNISARFRVMVYSAWLQEMIATGRIKFPGGLDAFLQKRAAATRSEWRGPARPEADALKAQKAHEGYKRMGVMTDEQICADLGSDYQDVYEQRETEKAEREKRGLPEGDTLNTAADEALVNSLISDDGGKNGG